MQSPLIMRLMAASVASVTRASDIIRKILSSGELGIIEKGVNDLQTQADRSSQDYIIGSLSKLFPGLAIIGEEPPTHNQKLLEIVQELDSEVLSISCPDSLSSVRLEDIVVWVDPLDGTNEFTQGLIEHVTVLVGIAVEGRPVGGVVSQPFYMPDYKSTLFQEEDRVISPELTRPRLIWGLQDVGIFGMKVDILPVPPVFHEFPRPASAPMDNVIVTTRSHSSQDSEDTIQACSPSKVFRVGGCGFKVLLLLEGVAHAYMFANKATKRWDTCAVEGLLRVAGGCLTGLNGSAYDYSRDVDPLNSFGLMATPVSAWHASYIRCIPTNVLHKLG